MKKNLLLALLSFFMITFSQTTHIVNSGAYYYSPSELVIEQGDIVVWMNDGGTHDVNGDINSITNESFNNPESFDSPATSIVGGEIFSHVFNIPGLYNYDCSVGNHAINGMVGSVTVNALSTTTVVDIIVDSENHNTLEAAVIAAELADDLSTEGPFTVFAPTDAAFDALPAGTVESLLVDPTGDLANILLHHVYSGNALSTDLSDGMMIPTLFGTELTVTFMSNGVMIDNAMVTVADIEADNGVVHVIDAVLLPEDDCEDNNDTVSELFGTFFINNCSALIDYLMVNYGYSELQACNWNGAPMLDLNGLLISDICSCSCNIDNTEIQENQLIKEPLFMMNLLGEIIYKPTYDSPLLIIYNDGSVDKLFFNIKH